MGIDEDRARVVRWRSAAESMRSVRSMAGREYWLAVQNGVAPRPPVMDLLRISILTVGDGEVVMALDPDEACANPMGSVQGGVVGALLDAATGTAVHTALPIGSAYTTVQLDVHYLRAAQLDGGRLVCQAAVLHRGRQVAVADGRVVDARDRLCATGRASCLIGRSPEPSESL